ncbi:tetratricopeptide repeat protein [Archangium lansingense]|uniref:Tetratricopeptide repeat protein n=1 Tax=Archangium lansingense TaxID=2995310 RepID=A0ABT4AAD6_9BACT|nr:tetratricopeptide repeat protein [Archangium lansinium]MCY1078633.1 tetratricopeptide repeat protein [Archangium lansinium]
MPFSLIPTRFRVSAALLLALGTTTVACRSTTPSGAPSPAETPTATSSTRPADASSAKAGTSSPLTPEEELRQFRQRRFGPAIEGCKSGNAGDCSRLAHRLLTGASLTERSAFEEALRGGCERRQPDACAGLGALLGLGTSATQANMEQALPLLQTACREGSSIGCAMELEARPPRTDDQAAQTEYLQKASAACERLGGSVCFTAASFLAATAGGAPDDARTDPLLAKACETGSAESCFQSGIRASEKPGDGPARARALYEKACGLDHGPACFNLGYQLLTGTGGPADATRGREIALQACHLGDRTACDYLGATNEGRVLPEELQSGRQPYSSDEERKQVQRRFCELGGAESCTSVAFALGDRAEKGGHPEEMEPVLGLLQKGCRRGSERACNVLGHVVKDAIRACEQDNGGQCLVAAFAYQQGIELPRGRGPTLPSDTAKARELFTKACERGIQPACERSR